MNTHQPPSRPIDARLEELRQQINETDARWTDLRAQLAELPDVTLVVESLPEFTTTHATQPLPTGLRA